jgi:hypothetical protein
MKKIIFAIMALSFTSSFAYSAKKELYKDSSVPIKDRVEDLLKCR